MIIKATSKKRKKKKKKTASILSQAATSSTVAPSSTVASSTVAVSTANNNEQDIDVMEDAGCIEVSNAIAAAENAANVTAIASHGLKNNKRGGGGESSAGCGIGSDDSSVDSNSTASVIDLDALRSTSVTTAPVSSTAVSSTTALSSNDDFDDDDDEDDLLIIDKGTLIAQDADNRTTYGIVIGMVNNQWSVEYKYKDGDNPTHTGITLQDNASILLAYNYFQNLPVEKKEVGYAMFGLMEFNVVFHTAELGFTYYNDSIIGKIMVQSSTSCHVNNNDILVLYW
ncbi:MAG: hypothetical protein ACI90V_008177 [Bacillariaceae sp.]|jgi:hypothetical protein